MYSMSIILQFTKKIMSIILQLHICVCVCALEMACCMHILVINIVGNLIRHLN